MSVCGNIALADGMLTREDNRDTGEPRWRLTRRLASQAWAPGKTPHITRAIDLLGRSRSQYGLIPALGQQRMAGDGGMDAVEGPIFRRGGRQDGIQC